MRSGSDGRSSRPNVSADADYVAALPGVVSELAVPLRSGRSRRRRAERRVGARAPRRRCPRQSVRSLARWHRSPRTVRSGRTLDLAALARLFVHLGSLREPLDIAALGAASLPKVLPVEPSQIVDLGRARHARPSSQSWRSARRRHSQPLSVDRASRSHARQSRPERRVSGARPSDGERGSQARDPSSGFRSGRTRESSGALVGVCRDAAHVDPVLLDTAAVLAAHVAASLDAAFALQRERQSAATDPLTGILNRRGLEERLNGARSPRRRNGAFRSASWSSTATTSRRSTTARGTSSETPSCARSPTSSVGRSRTEPRLLGSVATSSSSCSPAAGADVAESLGGQIRTRLAAGPDGCGLPAPRLGRHLDVSLRRCQADRAAARRPIRRCTRRRRPARTGSRRTASSRSRHHRIPTAEASGAPRTAERRGGTRVRERCSLMRCRRPRRSRPRRPWRACARVCARRSSSSSARLPAPRRASLGDYIVDASEHALREVSLGDEAAYRIADFPLTAEVLAKRQSRRSCVVRRRRRRSRRGVHPARPRA